MAKDLGRIQTIVIVMMENRSFDHLLGYLGLPDSGHPMAARIEGVQHALTYYAHYSYPPVPLTSATLDPDPPHEREDIDTQLYGDLSGPMKGFVQSYRRVFDPTRPGARLTGVMEYCRQSDIPITDFLARNFTICDNWFAPLPASTLPNRLMSMGGYALVDHTPFNYLQVLDDLFYNNPDDLLYDWLAARQIAWRVYHSASPFFMSMPRILRKFQDDAQNHFRFRPIQQLKDDFANEDVPQVVFIEPTYQDDPRRGTVQATDDHPPASLWGGQGFLKRVYEALTASPSLWGRMVTILTYDEHGAIFDHVPPPRIRTDPPRGARYSGFSTLGLRVPALVISPFAANGSLYEGLLDHTSILKFIGERFGGGKYTELVDNREVGSVSDALSDELLAPDAQIADPPQMP